MITEISRGYLKIEYLGKTAKIPGELFFLKNNEIEFEIFTDEIKHWEEPNEHIQINIDEKEQLLEEIKEEFKSKNRLLIIS